MHLGLVERLPHRFTFDRLLELRFVYLHICVLLLFSDGVK